jgi:uncharacterized protein YjbI with pentapeptide repeats
MAMRIENERHQMSVSGSDLSNSTFQDVNLSGCVFADVNMSGIVITNVDLSGARLLDCNLLGASIEGVPVKELFAAYRAVSGEGAAS